MSNGRMTRLRNDIREFEAAHLIAELTGQAQTVLNIGAFWGRDYYHLTELGKRVINVDIAFQYHLPHTVTADASRGLPFPAGFFDAVLLAEVLEHLVEDWIALREAYRVLKDDGALIVTVPLYQDEPLYHVRIHSPRTILRLLATTGFSVSQLIYRGGWTQVPRLVHAVRKALTPIGLSNSWYRLVVQTDRWWGKQGWSQRWAKGVYILAHKSETLDWRSVNKEMFRS